MKMLKRAYFSAVSALPINWLLRHASLDLLVPYHHLVSDDPVSSIQPLYAFKNRRQFESDLDYLLAHFQPVSLQQVIEQRKRGEPFRKKSFLLTFDDGLRQVYEVVMPLLLRKGVPAALFVCPGFIDNRHVFYDLKKGLILRTLHEELPLSSSLLTQVSKGLQQPVGSVSQLKSVVRSINYHTQQRADIIGSLLGINFAGFAQQHQPFMSGGQISAWISKGFAVGAHSMDHPLYSSLSLDQQLRQTIDSLNWVQSRFKLPYRSFAFPHVDTGVGKRFFTRLFEDQALAPDLVLGNRTGMIEQHPRVVHRYIGENPRVAAAAMAKAVLLYNVIRQALGREMITREE